MIQEYLLQDNTERDAIEAYNPSGILKRLFSVANDGCWYVQFSASGDNKDTAKALSGIDKHIKNNYHVTTLENGSSAYFNKKLYPLVSEFEHKLRKLLYLTSAINRDDKSAANISNLESQDFGQIFSMLFIDTDFMSKTKEEIKTRNKDSFSKTDVISAIEAIEENALWDTLLGKDIVPTLREQFSDVRNYRNDVMHSHHINWDKYVEIDRLYSRVNEELATAINDIDVREKENHINPSFNPSLDAAIQALKVFSKISELSKAINDESHLSTLAALSQSMAKLQEHTINYSHFLEETQESRRLVEQLRAISEAYKPNHELLALLEELKNTTAQTTEKISSLEQTSSIIENLKMHNSLDKITGTIQSQGGGPEKVSIPMTEGKDNLKEATNERVDASGDKVQQEI